jgi:hypothetical protein
MYIRWSNETSLRFSLDGIEDGVYDLFIDYDKVPMGAGVKILQRQNVVKELFDTFSADRVRVKMERVGVIEKSNFLNTISLAFMTNEKTKGIFFEQVYLGQKELITKKKATTLRGRSLKELLPPYGGRSGYLEMSRPGMFILITPASSAGIRDKTFSLFFSSHDWKVCIAGYNP